MKIILSKRIGDFLDDLQQDFPEAEFIHTSDDDDAVSKAVDVDVSFDIRTRGFVEAATQLQWIQTVSAGVNGAPFELLKKRGITLTNASANYGPNMADHTLALMLMLSRQIHIVQRRMRDKGWKCGVPTPDPGEVAGQALLIVGLGGIGMETAKRAAGFGMRVMATRRHTDRPKPDFVDSVHPPEALHDLLPQADWVDVPLPLTADTRDLISDREFALMKDGVHITNVGREYVINLEALMRALDSGKVGGAGLDVLGREAQDFSHPIWKYENIIITPHASGHGQAAFDRLGDLVKDNIRRFITDEPLRNVVDLDLEY